MKGLLEEKGKTSSMRVGMLLCIATACYIAILAVYRGSDIVGVTSLVVVLLGGGIGGKVMQKGNEK